MFAISLAIFSLGCLCCFSSGSVERIEDAGNVYFNIIVNDAARQNKEDNLVNGAENSGLKNENREFGEYSKV